MLSKAAEATAAATAEGLELVPSSNAAGLKGVSKQGGKYQAQVREDGKQHHLGSFDTPEEAALHYARYVGAVRAAAETAEARGEGLFTASEARAAAAAEGLELVPSSNPTGFKGVNKQGSKYVSKVKEDGRLRHLGSFTTPQEAALHFARHVGAARAAAEAAEARGKGPQPLTVAEAKDAAAAEGLVLVPSSNPAGFRGVIRDRGKYAAKVREGGKQRHIGTFVTPEEAALHYARRIGAARAAMEATEARGDGPKPLAAADVSLAAAGDGLELMPKSSNATGFKGVNKSHGKYQAKVTEDGKQRRFGSFETPEESAMSHAPHRGKYGAANVGECGKKRQLEQSEQFQQFQQFQQLEQLQPQPQLPAADVDDNLPLNARCNICFDDIDMSAASSSATGEQMWGTMPCGSYYHKRCLTRWLQGLSQSADRMLHT